MSSSGNSDSKTWNSFRNGEEWAISYIYTENAEKLYFYGLKLTPDRDLVEDVLQDIFAGLIKNRKSLGSTENIFFYLHLCFNRQHPKYLPNATLTKF